MGVTWEKMLSLALMRTCVVICKETPGASCTASSMSSVLFAEILPFSSVPCKWTQSMWATPRLVQEHLLRARLEKLCIQPTSQTMKQLLRGTGGPLWSSQDCGDGACGRLKAVPCALDTGSVEERWTDPSAKTPVLTKQHTWIYDSQRRHNSRSQQPQVLHPQEPSFVVGKILIHSEASGWY